MAQISTEEFMMFSSQFKQLLESDFPLAEGLKNFSGEIKKPSFKDAVERISKRLTEGMSISEAIKYEGEPFSPEYIGLIRAGEESNNLLKMLDTALDHETFLGQMEEKLHMAIYYPLIIFCWSLLAFAAVMVWAYPMVEEWYVAADQVMPLTFRLVHNIFYGPWGILAVLWISAVILCLWLIKARKGLGSLAMSIPGLRQLAADVFSARLARSLGLLLEAGASMDNALATVAASTGDKGMKRRRSKADAFCQVPLCYPVKYFCFNISGFPVQLIQKIGSLFSRVQIIILQGLGKRLNRTGIVKLTGQRPCRFRSKLR